MKNFNKLFLTILVSSAFFVSCSKDDKETPVDPRGNYEGGLFVVNEGNFRTPNGTISYLSDTSTIENDVFAKVNPGKIVGDTPQSIGFNGDLAYIVVNTSNKIEVVNRYTFKSVAVIDAKLKNPRYIAFANGKGYVTNWGDGADKTDDYVAVIDLTANTVSSTIPVVEGPEQIIENGGKLYVAHKGGWGSGNSLSIINSGTYTVTNLIVGDIPGSLVKDNGTLYVLCKGKSSYKGSTEIVGKLVKLNMSDNTISSTIDFPAGSHPGFLAIDNNKLYYTIGTSVYTAATNATALPTTELFKATDVKSLYGFAVKNNTVYIADALNYSDPGKIYIYSLTGPVSNKFDVGISPNGFYFNK